MSELIGFLENAIGKEIYELRGDLKKYEESSNYTFENVATAFVPDGSYDYEFDSYFKPLYIFGDTIFPKLEDVSLEAIQYWITRAENTENVVLKARYADLVWNFSRFYKGEIENPFRFAIMAIESYLEIVEQRVIDQQLTINEYTIRALKLAKKLNLKEKIRDIQKVMISVESQINEDELIGLWGFSFDELILEKSTIDDDQKTEIIDLIHTRLERLITKSQSEELKEDYWEAIEYGTKKLAKYHFLNGDNQTVVKLLDDLESVINNSKSQIFVKDYRYKRLYDLYQEVQITSENGRLLLKIEEASKENLAMLQPISSAHSFSKDEIDQFANAFISENPKNDILHIASQFIPKIDEHEKRIAERKANGYGLLSQFFDPVFVNEDGMPKTRLDLSIKEDRVANEMISSIPVQAQLIGFVMPRLIESHDLTPEKFAEHLSDTSIHSKENFQFLVSGIKSYFNRDYIAMIHILIPYIEATLRNIIKEIGLSTYKPNKKGGYDAILLGDILSIEQMKNDILGEDIHFYFKLVLNDARGLNLRNVVAHGLGAASMFNVVNANILIHILMILSLFKSDASPEVES
ncbi:MAG: DUF4209 domain-containing protein [Planococcus donghaensis]